MRLREARLARGYTQQELADKVGVSVVYLSSLERGTKVPSMEVFIKLVQELGASADYILGLPVKPLDLSESMSRLETLTPKQRKTIYDIINAYIDNL